MRRVSVVTLIGLAVLFWLLFSLLEIFGGQGWGMPMHPRLLEWYRARGLKPPRDPHAAVALTGTPIPRALLNPAAGAAAPGEGGGGSPFGGGQQTPQGSWSGSFNVPVILADFDDNKGTQSKKRYDDILFTKGKSSLRDFYLENSYGKFDVVGVTVGWYRMPKKYKDYADGQYGFGDYPNNAQRLAEDAVKAADKDVDFSKYDNDKDGKVETVFIVHAGPGAEVTGNPDDIWSHRWVMASTVTLDGVQLRDYTMQPEDGEVGVFAHEFGHALGLPDLYDRDYSSEGVGVWSVMAAGAWGNGGRTPSHFDAWCKKQLGWMDPEIVTKDTKGVRIEAAEDKSDSYYVWTKGKSSQEYFLLENRQQKKFDLYLPASGLLIYHVDETVTTGNDNESHYLLAIEQADGKFDLEKGRNSGDGGDPFPGSSSNRTFTSTTTPNSKSYGGDDTKVGVTNIDNQGGVVTCDIRVGSDTGDTEPPTVKITSPKNNDKVSGQIKVSADATDDVKVESVSFYVDSSLIGTARSSPYSVNWDTTKTKNGSRKLRAEAKDTSANTASDEITITVDNQKGPEDTFEPNDTLSQAYGPLVSGAVYESFIFHATDLDHYKTDKLSGSGTLKVDLDVPDGVDYDVFLIDPTFKDVASSRNRGNGLSEAIEHLVRKEGIHYVKVVGYKGAFSNRDPYHLKVEFEPFDTNYGAIQGRVLDGRTLTGIAGARVELSQVGRVSAQIDTNQEGRYNFPTVLPGRYDLTAAAQGYQSRVIAGQKVPAATTVTCDFVLRLQAPDPYEENDSFSSAFGPLIFDRQYQAFIQTSKDVDYFWVHVNELISLTARLDVPGEQDYDLFVYDPSLKLIASSTVRAIGGQEVIYYHPKVKGKYYIQVVSAQNTSSATMPYNLTVSLGGGTSDTYEPNDSFEKAYGALGFGTLYRSFIFSATDTDYYFIQVDELEPITIKLGNVPKGQDYDLYLFDSGFKLLQASAKGGVGADETITFEPDKKGKYYIRVQGFNSSFDPTSPYSLQVN